jgi:cytochrome b pre-mRNA-processing protein 3
MARLWRRRGSLFSIGVLAFPTRFTGASLCSRCTFSPSSTAGKSGDPEGGALAQELVDRFSQNMETVLRELGVSDMRVPQSMRRLAAASKGLFEDYETALAAGRASLAHAIAASLPGETESAELSSSALASYLMASIEALDRQDIASLRNGAPDFAEASVKP